MRTNDIKLFFCSFWILYGFFVFIMIFGIVVGVVTGYFHAFHHMNGKWRHTRIACIHLFIDSFVPKIFHVSWMVQWCCWCLFFHVIARTFVISAFRLSYSKGTAYTSKMGNNEPIEQTNKKRKRTIVLKTN